MSDHPAHKNRPTIAGFFKALATDQLICRAAEALGAIVGGPLGAALVPVARKAAEYFGPTVASSLWAWLQGQPLGDACAALEEVANLDPQTVRELVDVIVDDAAPDASDEVRTLTKNYLINIPPTLRQTMPRAPSGKSTCPASLVPRSEHDVFRLLPTFLPPYTAPCDLPGTPYELLELLGTGGFGAVYKAKQAFMTEPHAIKFCLDPERVDVLKNEKKRLEQMREQAADSKGCWPESVVRLIGYVLEHETPFLIFEYVPDGDLAVHVQNLCARFGHSLTPDDALMLMRELAVAVSHVHSAGLTHRDLKPSNILYSGDAIKIADFGLGGVVRLPNRIVSRSRSSAEVTQEMRGAGSILYMSPEQKHGVEAQPAQDVYSLGVIWHQILVEDFSAELGPFWDRPLRERAIPDMHIELLRECLDDRPNKRPSDAGVLVTRIDRIIQRLDEEERRQRERAELERVTLAIVRALLNAILGAILGYCVAAPYCGSIIFLAWLFGLTNVVTISVVFWILAAVVGAIFVVISEM